MKGDISQLTPFFPETAEKVYGSPTSTFKLFFDEEIINHIYEQTSIYAKGKNDEHKLLQKKTSGVFLAFSYYRGIIVYLVFVTTGTPMMILVCPLLEVQCEEINLLAYAGYCTLLIIVSWTKMTSYGSLDH